MSLPAAVAVGTGTSVVANVMTDAQGEEKSIKDLLTEMRDLMRANNAYNRRERERTPYIVPMTCTYTAGSAGADGTIFTPPSPMNLEYLIIALRATAAGELAVALSIGTVVTVYPVGASNPAVVNSGMERYDLPYHLTSQVRFAPVFGVGTFTGLAYVWLVGWLEQNRIGPRNVGGDM